MNQCYPRSRSIALQGSNGGGILSSDYGNIAVVERVRIFVVVQHLWQIFSRSVHPDRQVIVTRSDDDFACLETSVVVLAIGCFNAKVTV
jgi:hypothetical protein